MESKRILIVDDIEFNLKFEDKVIQSLSEELGIDIQIDTACTVEEALRKIKKNNPYDAMVLDMNLPDGSGVEIAKISRNKNKNTRLAALTIYPKKYEKEKIFFDIF